MSNIINLSENREPAPDDAHNIGDRTTPEFMQAAHALGEYLKDLPLSNVQHNTLIEHIKSQIEAAERGAFYQGFELGMRAGVDAAINGPRF